MSSNPKNNCPVCGSSKYLDLPYGGYFFAGTEMPLVRCSNCSLQYIIHGLKSADFDAFYADPRYFDSEYAGGASNIYAANEQAMKQKAQLALSKIARFKKSGRLLDVGCAGGYLLEVAKDRYGFEPVGLEISAEMVNLAKSRGLEVVKGTVADLPKDLKPFDVVYMGDVLEHIALPGPFMQILKSHMAEESLLALELPLTFNWTLSGLLIGLVNALKGKFGRRYFLPAQHRHKFEHKPPYHVMMFERDSINFFLRQQGFRLLYLKIYEGAPKAKFAASWYGRLKSLTHAVTYYLPQSFFGDRMIVIAQKI